MNKTNILWFTVGLLAILNATTIITMMYHNNVDMQEIVIEPDAVSINGRYFRQKLGFDDNQMDGFRTANRTFRQNAGVIVDDIEIEKVAMFKELTSENPSQENIDNISVRIGELHKQLKDATATFYLSLKSICTKEQQIELQSVFAPLFRTSPVHNNGECGNGN